MTARRQPRPGGDAPAPGDIELRLVLGDAPAVTMGLMSSQLLGGLARRRRVAHTRVEAVQRSTGRVLAIVPVDDGEARAHEIRALMACDLDAMPTRDFLRKWRRRPT